MLDSEARSVAGSIEDKELGEEGADEDLISQMADMSIASSDNSSEDEIKSVLNMDNPVFKVRLNLIYSWYMRAEWLSLSYFPPPALPPFCQWVG